MKRTIVRWFDSDVGYSFRTSPVAIVAALIALTCLFCAVFAGWVSPHNPFDLASLELGDQIEAQYLPITGIFYDHKDDLVGVTLEGLDHMIRHPQSIYVEESGDGVAAIAVIDGDGTNHLVKLRRPLALPAPDQ